VIRAVALSFLLLNRVDKVQECDANKADAVVSAGNKIFNQNLVIRKAEIRVQKITIWHK